MHFSEGTNWIIRGMVRFLIHHSVDGKTVYFSQFYQMNIQARKLEALMEIITGHVKMDVEREGTAPPEGCRYSTYVIESQEYSTSSLKTLQEEFEGIQIVYCEVGGIVISLGLHDSDSVILAKSFINSWVYTLKKIYKTTSFTNIYDRVDELLAYLDKMLPLGELLITNQSYREYLSNEASALTRSM